MTVAFPIDLHTHSLRSDGALSPAELVRRAAERGVRIQALADHDTLSGIAEARAAGERAGVRVIPAVELNTESEWGDVHVLAYFVDPADAALEERLRRLREERGRRIERMVEKLNALGYPLSIERVREIARGGAAPPADAETGLPPLGRPHLAQALFEAGHVPSYDAAFDTLIRKDSPAYVPRVGLAPLEAVALARAHGAVPSLAHPGTVPRLDDALPRLVEAGLAGLECYYGSHAPERTAHYLRLAARYDLIPTGGSDFHGRGEHGAPLGGVFVPQASVDALYHVLAVEGGRS